VGQEGKRRGADEDAAGQDTDGHLYQRPPEDGGDDVPYARAKGYAHADLAGTGATV
jgi:hypothetical protein